MKEITERNDNEVVRMTISEGKEREVFCRYYNFGTGWIRQLIQ
jgi:hypothetical protein